MAAGAARIKLSRPARAPSASSARRASIASPSQLGRRTPSVAPPSVGFGEEDAPRRGLAADHARARIVGLAERQAADRGRELVLHLGLAVGAPAPARAHEAALVLEDARHVVERVGVEGVGGAEIERLLEEPG